MHDLAVMLARGQGAARDDDEAVAWLRRAAEGGSHQAMLSLGILVLEGRGAARDPEAAAAWFRRAAEAPEPRVRAEAQRALRTLEKRR